MLSDASNDQEVDLLEFWLVRHGQEHSPGAAAEKFYLVCMRESIGAGGLVSNESIEINSPRFLFPCQLQVNFSVTFALCSSCKSICKILPVQSQPCACLSWGDLLFANAFELSEKCNQDWKLLEVQHSSLPD